MTLWRCECGWCNVVAESGMVSRPTVEQLERNVARPSTDDITESESD